MSNENTLDKELSDGFLQRALSRVKTRTVVHPAKEVEKARAAEKAARVNSDTIENYSGPRHKPLARTEVRQEALDTWPLPGLAPMTRLRTSFGDVPAIALRKGDELLTRDGEYLAIQWIDRINLDDQLLLQKPDANPVVIASGALGVCTPQSEIMVSPRQMICADEFSELSAEREAATLISRPGVRRLRETSLSYTMLHVGRAADLYCEGIYLSFPLKA